MPQRDLSIGEALDLGVQFAMAGNHASACTLFRGVLIHEPENFEAIERLGASLFELEEYHEALYWFWRGRKINRRHPMALTNYGLCVSQLGHWEEGLSDLERAAVLADKVDYLSPDAKALIFNNLGNTLERLKRHKEALPILDRAIAFNPTDHFPRYNRGIVLLRLNRHEEAIAELNRSLALKPNNPDALYNRSMAHLLMGDFKQGFDDYEGRLLTTENEHPNLGLPPAKKWQGEDLTGKRILVHAEQGLGDELQFLRFYPWLKTQGAAEILAISHVPVRPLVERIEGLTVLEPRSELTDRYDYWVAHMSLARHMGVAGDADIPPPLLPEIEPERIATWADKLALPRNAINIGVCWAGHFAHKNDAHRSIPLKTFAALFDAPGCNFVSVQQIRPGEVDEFDALKKDRSNLTAIWLDDLHNTAAVFANLDLVISADTSVAHLAASMGKETWVLIPKYSTDWRWQLDRTDSPWYPSARLIRQERIGDWETPLSRLKADLAERGNAKKAA